VRDALGPQVESTKMNQSHPTFGSGTRSQLEKVYQDAESEKTFFGRLSPGPCAYDAKARCRRPPETCRACLLSAIAASKPASAQSMPDEVLRCGLLTFTAHAHMKPFCTAFAPEPSDGCVQSGMGPQVLSDKRSNQTTGLGHGTRFNYDFVRRAKVRPTPAALTKRTAVLSRAAGWLRHRYTTCIILHDAMRSTRL
jgi:hypothetical protein